jgi:hypothetical protein
MNSKGPAQAAVTKLLSAMTDDEVAEVIAQARGIKPEQVAELLMAAEYKALNAQGAKDSARQALRQQIGGN